MTDPFRPQPDMPHVLRHDPTPCPTCGRVVDAVVTINAQPVRNPPDDGDYSICDECASVSMFTVSALGVVGLRPLTAAELTTFQNDPEGVAALRRMQRYVRHRRGSR